MPQTIRNYSDKTFIGLTLVVILVLIIILLAGSWVLTRGVENGNSAEQAPESGPSGPANMQGTGGGSGVGSGANNDPNEPAPSSPAGGVDTNQIPSGSVSPPTR